MENQELDDLKEEIILEDAASEDANGDKSKKKKEKDKKKDKKQDEFDQTVDRLTAQRDENHDRYLRTLAEFDNFRKRTAREKASMYDDGLRDAALGILPVADSFQRAMSASGEDDQVCKGFQMILKQLMETLKSMGVEEIDALGKPFDPNYHDAVMHVDDEARGQSEVAEVLLKGYMFKDKVLRHSMVKVAN